jgi:hypothetical protein
MASPTSIEPSAALVIESRLHPKVIGKSLPVKLTFMKLAYPRNCDRLEKIKTFGSKSPFPTKPNRAVPVAPAVNTSRLGSTGNVAKKVRTLNRLLARVLQNHDAPDESEKGESMFDWVVGKQKNHGQTRQVSRQAGTIKKDWAIIKSYDLRESFCIAVIGHEGWNNDPNATASYALVVSFESVNTDIPIYAEIAKVQVPIEVESEVSITVQASLSY